MPKILINNTPFYNVYAAFTYAAYNAPHAYPVFDLYNDTFNRMNWSTEPSESYQSMMDRRAIQLREKYEKLILCFSGGTDSRPIYETFKRLNIRLDEIVVAYHDDPLAGHEPAMIKWLHDNLYDKTIPVTIWCRDDIPEYLNTVKPGYLLEPNQIFFPALTVSVGGNISWMHETGQTNKQNTGIIVGLEKPVVIFKDGKWWATAIDKNYRAYMYGSEYFYISPDLPELHMKQCHLLKNYAKQFINPSSYWSSAEFSGKSWQNYRLYSLWCGRSENLSINNAVHQKTYEAERPLNVRTYIDKEWAAKNPMHQLHGYNTRHFENRNINKIYNELGSIQMDQKVIEYMERMHLLHETKTIDQYCGLFSPWYDMGA